MTSIGRLLAIVVLFAAPTELRAGKKPASQRPTDLALVEGNNQFALDLYAKLRQEKGNLLVSPYSISTALAMTYAGALGETATQMAKVMRFTLPEDRLHKAMGEMVIDPNKAGQKNDFQLATANALWAQKDYAFLNGFLTTVQSSYKAELGRVDYARDKEQARKVINKWVEDKTNDKIKDLIAPNVLDELTRLVLTNAIYFKGAWVTQFKADNTQDEPFTLLDGTKLDVSTMHQTESFGYAENERCQVLELGYVGGRVSMVVLLPKRMDGLPDVEKSLNAKTLKIWLSGLRRQQVAVALPKFKYSCGVPLAKTLVAMGMLDAFDTKKADFSKMTGERDLFISQAIHKAFIDLNEEGTEAAAATAVVMRSKSAVVPAQPKSFVADHPFLFLIRDVRTGSVLFLGRVVDPSDTK